MTRWDYDTVFYRVFCSALLGVALTFTVILTNVFIDIHGLLNKNNKANSEKLETVQADVVTNTNPHDIYEDNDYVESYGERTKRSLETQNAFHIKDPNIKKIITNRLAALLDDMDRDEPSKHKQYIKSDHNNDKYTDKHNDKYTDQNKFNFERNYKAEFELIDAKNGKVDVYHKDHNNDKNTDQNNDNFERNYKAEYELIDAKNGKVDVNDNSRNKAKGNYENDKVDANVKGKVNEEDLKHLAMHNIILQGIVGHVELGEVYGKVHALFHNDGINKVNLKEVLHPAHEKIFFNELTNCKQLRKEIAGTQAETTTQSENISTTVKPQGRNVIIKAIIDISSLVNDRTNQNESNDKVNGIIKLIFNGKTLKFKRVEENTTIKPNLTNDNEKRSTTPTDIENIKDVEDKILDSDMKESTYVPNAFMHKVISDYLKRLSKTTLDNNKKITTKRLKRHIKIRYENEQSSSTTETSKHDKKKGDDELYVEIETHFDSKGLKGEKKKKIIRELIEKIQKAIHSDSEVKKKKHKHMHVKKRTQNPLDDKTTSLVKEMLMPLNNLMHRHLAPISKSVPIHDPQPHVSDDKGEEWKEKVTGPRFLTPSKAINSAEMSAVDTDYNVIMDNGIPQRLQKPLNTEVGIGFEKHAPENSQYVVKDIAGSGFSIGFNQYVDEPPDKESMKLFTGIENIIQTYHQKYDDEDDKDNPLKQVNNEPLHYEYPSDDHTIVRRSIKNFKHDYHSNEYKVIFNKNFMNYNNYQDIYNTQYTKAKKDAKDNLLFSDNIFNKELNPSEIFSLADILERQKRTLNVKKISNIKSKKKLNRYINTKTMASKKIFQQKKRNKRQIGKIRIIAKDVSDNLKHSGEDIFVFSNEKIFADRAMVKEVETPDVGQKETIKDEHFDVISAKQNPEDFDEPPQHLAEDHFDIISPYGFETPLSGPNSIFTRKSRHNSLMSKYPHIFMEEISKSKEEFSDNQVMYAKVPEKIEMEATTQLTPPIIEMPQPRYIPGSNYNYAEVNENMDHPQTNGNYKVTVKIMPKNRTGVNSGFKEIHTSINKSFNKNGLVYTSLVNVSEISKVEKINKTKDNIIYAHPNIKKLKRDQMRMKNIILQHKNRIEEQLEHLNREKEKLDRMDLRNADILRETPKDFIDFIPSNPETMTNMYTDERKPLLNTQDTKTEQHTTTEHMKTTTENPEKLQIIQTIERNEKITNEILQKIDKNTNILQTFLDKLINKIEVTTKTEKDKESPTQAPETRNNDYNLSQLLFQMPKQNISGMPFVYAFQQPYKTPKGNKNIPIASVIYQGHIHTETFKPDVNKINMWEQKWKKIKPNKVEINNSSKFFIDDIEEYKVLPVVGKTEFAGNITKA